MYRVVLRCFIVVAPLLVAQPASAEYGVWVDGQNMRSPFMHVYGRSMPPIPSGLPYPEKKHQTLCHVTGSLE